MSLNPPLVLLPILQLVHAFSFGATHLCGLSAGIAVYAENEAEARAKAVDQLRLRGLKVA
jgi:hypothetical protein